MIDLHKIFPLRWFFPLIAVIPIFFAACLAGAFLDSSISNQLDDRLERNLRGLGENISNSSEFALQTKNIAELNKLICAGLHLSAEINEIEILDERSVQVSDCRRMVKVDGESVSVVLPIHPLDRDQLKTSNKNIIIGYVRITSAKSIVESEKRQIRLKIFGILSISVLLTLSLSYLFTRKLAGAVIELSVASKSIAGKNFHIKFSKILGGELGQMQKSFLEMSRTMSDFTKQLNNNVAARTKELESQKVLLEKAYSENKRLIHRINGAIENERKVIALDLHDVFNTVILHILGTARQTKSILRKITQEVNLCDAQSNLDVIEKNANHLYALSKDLVSNLRPDVLDEFGLAEALHDLVDKQGKSDIECQYSLILNGHVPRFDYDFNIAVYRIVQESLSNVAKHAKAAHCNINLTVIEKIDQYRLVLSIEDDGNGFDISCRRQGFGLDGMRERSGGIGGILEVSSTHGTGSKVMFSVDKNIQSHLEI
ncbi:ATP-binding protein [Undibacterium sp. TJN19]|uniref:sensor histidine kinase n=1 Tax=Undibacterium sp. TJN19 TaxID=3413055 RepID=UPI003BF01512